MRLYAYEDRFGDPRFGVLVDGQLLTGGQLEKRGRARRDVIDAPRASGADRLDGEWRGVDAVPRPRSARSRPAHR